MKNKSFLGLLLFSCICLTAIAQETTKPIKAIYVNADQNTLFDKLMTSYRIMNISFYRWTSKQVSYKPRNLLK